MGDVALCSERNEELLYRLFGINAELLIDHAWGWEPTTIAEIKSYKPESTSMGSGQVLSEPYPYKKAKVIIQEMADLLSYDLLEKGLVTNQIVLEVGYDVENREYNGEYSVDRYGRKIPKHAHGTENLDRYTSSTKLITEAAVRLFDRIINKNLNIRRVYIVAGHTVSEDEGNKINSSKTVQISIFDDIANITQQQAAEQSDLEKERRMQEAVLGIRKKYGKNAVLTGTNYEDGATTKDRNKQIGGHKA